MHPGHCGGSPNYTRSKYQITDIFNCGILNFPFYLFVSIYLFICGKVCADFLGILSNHMLRFSRGKKILPAVWRFEVS